MRLAPHRRPETNAEAAHARNVRVPLCVHKQYFQNRCPRGPLIDQMIESLTLLQAELGRRSLMASAYANALHRLNFDSLHVDACVFPEERPAMPASP